MKSNAHLSCCEPWKLECCPIYASCQYCPFSAFAYAPNPVKLPHNNLLGNSIHECIWKSDRESSFQSEYEFFLHFRYQCYWGLRQWLWGSLCSYSHRWFLSFLEHPKWFDYQDQLYERSSKSFGLLALRCSLLSQPRSFLQVESLSSRIALTISQRRSLIITSLSHLCSLSYFAFPYTFSLLFSLF